MGFLTSTNLIILGGIYLTFGIIWWILQAVANWRIFTKAGEAGWKSIIPIYGDHVSYRIAWKPSYFWLLFVLQIVASAMETAIDQYNVDSLILSLLIIIITIIIIVIGIIYSVKLARAFGKGIGFTIGLILFQPIFMLILGFGKSEYRGANL